MDLLLRVPEPHATAEGKADCVLYAVQVTLEKPLARHLDATVYSKGTEAAEGVCELRKA
jgi:hypothetical protein